MHSTYKYSSLPYGKHLTSPLLKTDLTSIVDKNVAKAQNLASVGSSQGNESLNMTVAFKAPKTKHFSEYASLGDRIRAGVAQKKHGVLVCSICES